MRILFLSSEFGSIHGTGGIGTYLMTLGPALVRDGHDVHVLVCRDGADPTDEIVEGVEIHVRPHVKLPGLRFVWRGAFSRTCLVGAVSARIRARALGRFDVVEAPDWQALGLLFVTLPGSPPTIATIHTPHRLLHAFDRRATLDDRVTDRLEGIAVRRAARIVAPTRLVIDRLSQDGWLGGRSVDLVRLPIDVDRFADLPPPSTSGAVVAIGRIEPRKRPQLLLDAAAELNRRGHAIDVQFVGRGSGYKDGLPFENWLADRAASLGVAVDFRPEIEWADMPSVYAQARVVCVCSHFESFSMVVGEAMAAARPVVVTENVGAGEILPQNSGQRVPDDVASIADTLETLLSDAALADHIGQENRRAVLAACNPAAVARRQAALFELTISGRRARRPEDQWPSTES